MIVLTPVSEDKTISILPRISDFIYVSNVRSRVEYDNGTFESGECIKPILDIVNDIQVVIRKDGENTSETLSNVSSELNQNYVELTFPVSILEEGSFYSIECSVGGNLMYRDKIYSTATTDFTVKYVQAANNYEQYNKTVSNEYVVID